MFRKKRNRKNKSPFIFAGIVFVVLGISLVFASLLIFFYPFWIGKPFLSPLALNSASKNDDIENILKKAKINFTNVSTASDSSYMVSLVDNGVVFLSPQKILICKCALYKLSSPGLQ